MTQESSEIANHVLKTGLIDVTQLPFKTLVDWYAPYGKAPVLVGTMTFLHLNQREKYYLIHTERRGGYAGR